ncbi:hypothetical protein AB5I41_30365 [Sphingomonas sp. MMS24-JH45]
MAMLLAERGGALPDILATDISAAAVARARTGTYTQFEIQRGLPAAHGPLVRGRGQSLDRVADAAVDHHLSPPEPRRRSVPGGDVRPHPVPVRLV